MKKSFKLVFVLFIVSSMYVNAQNYEANWESLDSRPVPEWFADARFGIFIHWGVYSVPAWAPTNLESGQTIYQKYSEWYWKRLMDPKNEYFRPHHEAMYGSGFKYQDFATDFDATYFDADQWADLFKRSGAKYIVLTSKHHDGFTLWPSRESWNWNSVDIGPHRDICGELNSAIRAKGLHMGFYYSLYEWFNPLYKDNLEKYVDTHMIPQIKDLVTRYEPDLLWTDGEWDHNSDKWKSEEILAWLYNESPVKEKIAVNDRWGKETRSNHGGYYTTEYDLVHSGEGIDDAVSHPWEECRGIGGSFGWNRTESLEDYSTSEEIIHILIEKVSAGGNLLLNVGPTADGHIPVIMQQRLMDIGDWLKVNGEAIYETRVWDNNPSLKKVDKIFFTTKGSDLYVIVTKWHKQIVIPQLSKAKSVTLLGSDLKVNHKFSGSKLTIQAPDVNPGNIPCNHAWVYKIENAL
ncbi:MAG: alpha-L-fucosidase [Bacteroidales bacterium]|nr:alpha-L-fucosidase [Bacteroidales bacterium]